LRQKSAVCGIGETRYYKRGDAPHTEFQLACLAIKAAAEDAGLPLSEIDGFVSYSDSRNGPTRLSAALGIDNLRFAATTWPGGGNTAAAAMQIADAAVRAGYARNIVVFRAIAQGQFGRYGQARAGSGSVLGGTAAFNAPYGLLTPAQQCALRTAAFMDKYGVSQEALCDIAMACFANAQLNPRALQNGHPLTREKYHASRWIVTPYHLYDCCPENDGAAASIVTSAERARDMRSTPAYIVATAQGDGPSFGEFGPDNYTSSYYGSVASNLWNYAGLTAQDMDVVQFYENFTGAVLIALAEMGFAPMEGIQEFVSDDALVGPDAKLPFNTSGGNIAEAYIHGFGLINEAVRQVRGESTCQVKDVEHSLMVAGPGYAPGSALVLGATA